MLSQINNLYAGSTCEAKGLYSATQEIEIIQRITDWPSCAAKCRELSDCTHWGWDGYGCFAKGGNFTPMDSYRHSSLWITGYRDCTPGYFRVYLMKEKDNV